MDSSISMELVELALHTPSTTRLLKTVTVLMVTPSAVECVFLKLMLLDLKLNFLKPQAHVLTLMLSYLMDTVSAKLDSIKSMAFASFALLEHSMMLTLLFVDKHVTLMKYTIF